MKNNKILYNYENWSFSTDEFSIFYNPRLLAVELKFLNSMEREHRIRVSLKDKLYDHIINRLEGNEKDFIYNIIYISDYVYRFFLELFLIGIGAGMPISIDTKFCEIFSRIIALDSIISSEYFADKNLFSDTDKEHIKFFIDIVKSSALYNIETIQQSSFNDRKNKEEE